MKNPFARNKAVEEDEGESQLESLSIADLEARTAAIEAEREEKRQAREEKKFHKVQADKRKRIERWIAPFLLLLTLICSFLIYLQAK